MRQLLLSFLTVLFLSSCQEKPKLTEARLRGAWHCLKQAEADILPDDMIIYKRGRFLNMANYYSQQSATLNQTADSITFQQGCTSFVSPVAIHMSSDPAQDTLLLHGRRFTRADSATFVDCWHDAIEDFRARIRLKNKRG